MERNIIKRCITSRMEEDDIDLIIGSEMMNVCTLDRKINTCKFFDKETCECCSENPCGMVKKLDKINVPQERKEKWYDKYYKR